MTTLDELVVLAAELASCARADVIVEVRVARVDILLARAVGAPEALTHSARANDEPHETTIARALRHVAEKQHRERGDAVALVASDLRKREDALAKAAARVERLAAIEKGAPT